MSVDFDAIVVGSGITGGWAAKELTERGLKVLMIERGPPIEHQQDYTTEMTPPWAMKFRGEGDETLFASDYALQRQSRNFDEWTYTHWVNDREHPYQTSKENPFLWIRGYQLGGKSLTWGRQCFRWSASDFEANLKDGHGVDWPVRYDDLAPWYDHVENFIGVSGSREGLAQLPDGQFQPPMALNPVERHLKSAIEAKHPNRRLIIGRSANMTQDKPGRSKCQYRNICARGCSFGAYFSTQSSTLPAARATGNLTLLTDHVVAEIMFDAKRSRATGVRVIDRKAKSSKTYTAAMVFLNAGTLNSVGLLLRSRSADAPQGLGNSSGTLGQYLMDHAGGMVAIAKVNGFDDHRYFGNRPSAVIIPRFRNFDEPLEGTVRGYSYQGFAARQMWRRGMRGPGLGKELKDRLHGAGDWIMSLGAFVECLPNAQNRATLANVNDGDGLPQMRIDFTFSDNERKLFKDAARQGREMMGLIDSEFRFGTDELGPPGLAIHEMGGARMGRDPKTSVVNARNQLHDVPNVFVTDGAMMSSSSTVNPSLTYMAFTARAAAFAADEFKAGRL